MDSLKQRIVDYVAANQPVKRADLIVVIGISGKGLDREVAALRGLGLIFSMAGFGYFSSEADYQEWRKGAGALHLKNRAMNGAFSSAAARRVSDDSYPVRIASVLSDGSKLGAAQIAEAMGTSYRSISSVISVMVNSGELKFEGPKGHRVYSLAQAKKKAGRRADSVNVICQECRNSAVMKRILSVYGVRA
ncbi:ArsR family transcriptional regulator [unidentified bacterial endosymbiont]|uniref:ArsR family transcriptional regulator n=1 Tax=unidentified bacterial endosymbiont TaxID=2355 RepID=UPI0020A04B86|nr:ArsR family transcriptional regulator [unidentified bacterial endosymbiont]